MPVSVKPFQNPKVWGPFTWYLLHGWSYSHEDDLSNYYHRAYDLLGLRLPCPSCRDHFNAYKRKHKATLSTRDEHITWVKNFHNAVNHRLHKPQWSSDRVDRHYGLVGDKSFKWNPGKWAVAMYIFIRWIAFKTKGQGMQELRPLLLASLGNIKNPELRKKLVDIINKFKNWNNGPELNKLVLTIKHNLNK